MKIESTFKGVVGINPKELKQGEYAQVVAHPDGNCVGLYVYRGSEALEILSEPDSWSLTTLDNVSKYGVNFLVRRCEKGEVLTITI